MKEQSKKDFVTGVNRFITFLGQKWSSDFDVLSLYSYTFYPMEKNWFVTNSFANWFKNQYFYFLPFYKCYSQRVEVFRGYFQKDRFFLKKIDSNKESDRTYSFDIFTLLVLL